MRFIKLTLAVIAKNQLVQESSQRVYELSSAPSRLGRSGVRMSFKTHIKGDPCSTVGRICPDDDVESFSHSCLYKVRGHSRFPEIRDYNSYILCH